MKKPKFIPEFKDIPAGRQKLPELPLKEREGSFEEVELGFTEEMALTEAARCLSCRRCIGCGLCASACPSESITMAAKLPHEASAVYANDMDLIQSMAKAREKPFPFE